MHQFRHIIQFLVVAICLVLGGHQVTAEVFALADNQTSILADTDQDIAKQYPDLPIEVARSIRSVVATQQVLNDSTKQGLVASGVVLNDQQVLSAGHAVGGDGLLGCKNTSIISPGIASSATTSTDAVSHAAYRYTPETDLSVLTIQDSDNFRSLPNISLATQSLHKGDTVYFINFQPTADGTVRSPAAEGAYAKPVIFSGLVIESSHNRVTIATGYSKSYGLGIADNTVRKGASGGAVLNVRGELVGLSVASDSLQADRTAASIAKQYGVGLPAQFNYQVAYMQPVSQSLIENLQQTTTSCGL